MKLHLGCGRDLKQGYINCDLSSEVKPDKVVNLENKLPFKDNSVGEILANHVLEHIDNFVPLMHEFHRVCKKNAKITIRTPFYSSWGQFNDPTHKRFFTPWTFSYFRKGTYSHEVNANRDMFETSKVRIHFGIGRLKKLNFILDPLINLHQGIYCRFFAWVLPSSEIEFELRVLK